MSRIPAVVFCLLAASGVTLLCLAQGCSIRDIIQVDVPKDVQAKTGSPPRVPLSHAEELTAAFQRITEREAKDRAAAGVLAGKQFQRELAEFIDQGEERARKLEADFSEFRAKAEAANTRWLASVQKSEDVAGWIGAALNTGLDQLKASGAAAVPGGIIGVGLLSGLAGLFLPKPGTAAAQQKAEADAKAQLAAAVAAAEARGYDMGKSETLATLHAAPKPGTAA